MLFDIKQTDVRAELDSPIVQEFAHARGPVPVARRHRTLLSPAERVRDGRIHAHSVSRDLQRRSITGEDADFNLFGTVNFTNYIGAQFGYRSFDVGYKFEDDTGSFVVKGPYFGIVARY